MTTILRLSASPAKRNEGYSGFSVIYDLTGKPDPLPRELVEIKTTADALAALEAYKAKATATGLSLAVSMRIQNGRAPNGFKKAVNAMPYFHGINI